MTNKSKLTKIWIITGKVSAIIFAIGTSYQITTSILSKDIEINSKVKSTKFILPANVSKFTKEIKESKRLENDENFLKLEDFLENRNPYKWSFVELEIINTGEKIVKNINVEIKDKGFYQIEGEEYTTYSFKNMIKIEELRPSAKLNISIWVSNFNEYEDDAIKITHENGYIIPSKGETVYGFFKFLGTLPLGFKFFFGFIFLVLLYFLIPLYYQIKYYFSNTLK